MNFIYSSITYLKEFGVKMFCIICSVRYSNPKLMHVGHQYMADNFDPKTFTGLLEFKSFHITPDKG